MSPTVLLVMMTSGRGSPELAGSVLQAHPPFDLVGDVRVAEVLAAALLGGDNLAGGDVGGLAQVDVQEAFVVADVQVGLGAVVGDEHLTVLKQVVAGSTLR